MIQVIEIDKTGTVIGSKLVEDGFKDTECLKKGWSGYFLKPQFSILKNKWIESATKEELEAAHTVIETGEERLAQQISALEIEGIEKDIKMNDLSQQNELLGQQLSDIEIQLLGGV